MTELHSELMSKRVEKAFAFDVANINTVEEVLQNQCFREIRYSCPYTQTVYFATSDGVIASNGYLRARRYSDVKDLETFKLLNYQKWTMEAKLNSGIKERCEMSFEVMMDLLFNDKNRILLKDVAPNIFGLFNQMGIVFPVVATEWKRKHYAKSDELRATIDTNSAYFAFTPGELEASLMGSSEECKLEIKATNDTLNTSFTSMLPLKLIQNGSHEIKIRNMYERFMSNKLK